MAEHRISIEDIWKESGSNMVVPTSEELAKKEARFRSLVSRSNLLEYLAGIFLLIISAYFAVQRGSVIASAGWVMTMAATVFIMTTLYLRSKGDGPVYGNDTVAHYLVSLIRRRDLLSSIWKWYVLPLLPGFILLRIDMHLLISPEQQLFHFGYDFLVLILASALGFLNRRKAMELETEIKAIRQLQGL